MKLMNKERFSKRFTQTKLFQLDFSHKAYPEAEQNYIFLSAPTETPGITDPTTTVTPPQPVAPKTMHRRRKRSTALATFDTLGGSMFKLGMSAGRAMASTGIAARTALVGMTQTQQPNFKPHSETATTSSDTDSNPDPDTSHNTSENPETPIIQHLYGKSHIDREDGKDPNPTICKWYNDRLSPLALVAITSIAILLTTVCCSGCYQLSKGTKYNPRYLDDLWRQE